MATKPQVILVMRHAEKPADPADPDLSSTGQERAAELAKYIPATFGDLDFLFAAAISKHSARPFETVKPFNVILQVKYSSFDSTVARIVEPF